MLTKVDEMPTSGQFVAVWEYDNKIWSETLLWINGELAYYERDECEFFSASDFTHEFTEENLPNGVEYYVLKTEN